MVRSLSYKMIDNDLIDTPGYGTIEYDDVGYKTSETYYATQLGKGDEIADHAFNFTSSGAIKSKSAFEYGTTWVADGVTGIGAFSETNSEDVMVRSLSYKMIDNDPVGDPEYGTIEYDDVGYLTSETYYAVQLGKGDEIADRSFNFTSSGVLKSKSTFEYGTMALSNGQVGNSAFS